jgi:hypothetical protein
LGALLDLFGFFAWYKGTTGALIYKPVASISYRVVQSKSVTMKPYFGLRGTSLNIMISIIAGLDFLYVPFTFWFTPSILPY